MSADHRDRAEPTRIAAENGAACDADHLESSGGVTAVHTHYVVVVETAVPADNDVRLGIRYSQSSTFISSGYRYEHDDLRNGLSLIGTSTSANRIETHIEGVSNVSTEGGFSASFDFYSVGGSIPAYMTGTTFSTSASANTNNFSTCGGNLFSTTAIDGIRFLFASGNIASGTFKLYGVL